MRRGIKCNVKLTKHQETSYEVGPWSISHCLNMWWKDCPILFCKVCACVWNDLRNMYLLTFILFHLFVHRMKANTVHRNCFNSVKSLRFSFKGRLFPPFDTASWYKDMHSCLRDNRANKASVKPAREWQVDELHFKQWHKELCRGQYLKLQVLNWEHMVQDRGQNRNSINVYVHVPPYPYE